MQCPLNFSPLLSAKIAAVLAAASLTVLAPAQAELPEVAPMDWTLAAAADVADADVYRPVHGNGHRYSLSYYLGHFHRLANAVRSEEPTRGFIDLSVWRRPRDNEPYNARIMENILSLAWFYAKEEAWNPYHDDPATRERLEAAMRFWLQIQHDDGRFSEYGDGRWNLAGTAFATKFMAEALVQLRDGPPLDEELFEEAVDGLRRALFVTFTSENLWNHARRLTNQLGNAFAGGLAYLQLRDDPEIAKLLERRLRDALEEFQSPAGYMYEANGPDWGYYFGTHHSNVHMTWHYGREMEIGGTRIGDLIAEEYAGTTEWLAYNAVPQPDGERFFLNRAIETRQSRASFQRIETPLAEAVPLVRAFSVTETERDERLAASRRETERDWGDPRSLNVGGFSGYSPYAFLHRDHITWHPGEEEREEARRELPYFASDRFVHQRKDDRVERVFTYVRRPGYYLAFNSGESDRARTRGGIGLLWRPEEGVLLQSQTGSNDFSWGTRFLDDRGLREAGDLDAAFWIGGEKLPARVGARDLPEGELRVTYSLAPGEKELRFADDSVFVDVAAEGEAFVEQLPLLLDDGDEAEERSGQVRVMRQGEEIVRIVFDGAAIVEIEPGNRVDGLRLTSVRATAEGSLAYEIRFAPGARNPGGR